MTTDIIKILLPYQKVKWDSLKPEQKICVEFANSLRALTLEGKLPYIWYHIPNEFLPSTRVNFTYDLKQKHMGKISGAPDYCFVGKGDGFFIEFKTSRESLTSSQKIFRNWCEIVGTDYYVCQSAQEGMKIVKERAGI
jgi:hypothetical protein